MIMDLKVKLIAIDVDGTLVNSKKELSTENIEAIKYAVNKGIKVMIASGRPLSGIKQYEMPFEEDIPFITFNGAMVVRKDSNKILYNKTTLGNGDFQCLFQVFRNLRCLIFRADLPQPYFLAVATSAVRFAIMQRLCFLPESARE